MSRGSGGWQILKGVKGYWILGGGLSELVDIKGGSRNE